MKRTPIKRRRDTPRRTALRAEHGQPWQEVRLVVYRRAGGRCEGCGYPLGNAMEVHHRLTRRFGPDCPCNVLALCSTCHHTRVHGHPAEAKAEGWIVSRHSPLAPVVVQATIHGIGPVFLTCDGAYSANVLQAQPDSATVTDEHPSREGARPEEPPVPIHLSVCTVEADLWPTGEHIDTTSPDGLTADARKALDEWATSCPLGTFEIDLVQGVLSR